MSVKVRESVKIAYHQKKNIITIAPHASWWGGGGGGMKTSPRIDDVISYRFIYGTVNEEILDFDIWGGGGVGFV